MARLCNALSTKNTQPTLHTPRELATLKIYGRPVSALISTLPLDFNSVSVCAQ